MFTWLQSAYLSLRTCMCIHMLDPLLGICYSLSQLQQPLLRVNVFSFERKSYSTSSSQEQLRKILYRSPNYCIVFRLEFRPILLFRNFPASSEVPQSNNCYSHQLICRHYLLKIPKHTLGLLMSGASVLCGQSIAQTSQRPRFDSRRRTYSR